jgi:stringent starvation protein B
MGANFILLGNILLIWLRTRLAVELPQARTGPHSPACRVMNPDERPSKRDAFTAFLREGWVSLHLDARRSGVSVPPSFATEPHLVLQYGRNMPIPIPDLEVTDDGVSATLSFSRAPHRTHVPWSAVYVVACTDGRGILYYEDVPQEVSLMPPPGTVAVKQPPAVPAAAEAALADDDDAEDELAEEAPRELRRLRSVPADVDVPRDEPTEVEVTAPAARRRRRPQLRLVK